MPRLKFKSLSISRSRCFVYAVLACFLGQAAAKAANGDLGQATTLARLTALRDAFGARIKADGFTCPIAPPVIVIDNVSILWRLRRDDQRPPHGELGRNSPRKQHGFVSFSSLGLKRTQIALMPRSKKPSTAGFSCMSWVTGGRPAGMRMLHMANYQIEYGANRIALAYWREADPDFADRMLSVFHSFVAHVASPVPAGLATEPYFNTPLRAARALRRRIGGISRAHESLQASQEEPAPRFAKALAETRP